MQLKKTRTIPFAAAVSLTFGSACGEDGPASNDMVSEMEEEDEDEPLTDEGVAAEHIAFLNTICDTYAECEPDLLASRFEDVEGCEDFYASDVPPNYIADITAAADDPDACREALLDSFRCYATFYTEMSCEDFEAAADSLASELDGFPCEDELDAEDVACEG